MNIQQSMHYFSTIGLELRPSELRYFRWKMMAPNGLGTIIHYRSLKDVWNGTKMYASSHLKQACVAKLVLDIVSHQTHPDWMQVEKWFHDEVEHLPAFISELYKDHEDVEFPHKWRAAYAQLMLPYGHPENPILGRAIERGMLALHQKDPACCHHDKEGTPACPNSASKLGLIAS
ncbi:hypothetical protein ABIE09_002370 [Lysobacter enzymogenes]|uniref:hypothetical protein n=1 Tax=Lysobacter enzymogenes TaxID=69 RepID=UPI00339594A3